MVSRILIIIYFMVVSPFAIGQENQELMWNSAIPTSKESINQQLLIADSLERMEEWNAVLNIAKIAKIKALSINYKLGEVKAAIAKAKAFFNLKMEENAEILLENTLSICRKEYHTAEYKPYILNMLAVTAAYKGLSEKSIHYFKEALAASKIAENSEVTEAYMLNNIAYLYFDMKMYDNANLYLKKAEEAFYANPNPTTRVLIMMTKVSFLEQKKDIEGTKKLLAQVVLLADSLNDNTTVFIAYEKLAGFALIEQEWNKVEEYVAQIEKIAFLEPILKVREFRIIATVAIFKKNFKKAIEEYEKMLALANDINNTKWRHFAYQGLSTMNAKLGNYKLAYAYEMNAKALKDSLNEQEQKRNVANFEQKYQAAEKDKEIAEKELVITQKNSAIKTRNIVLIAAILIISLLSALIFIVRKSHRRKQRMKDEKLRLFKREKELDEMRALMNGEEQERNRIARDIHDGLMIQFSTVKMNLSSVLEQQQDVKPYLQQLDKAISSLRSTAHNLMPDVLLEGGLAEAIYYFCENIKKQVVFELTFSLLDDVPRFNKKFELAVYRIVQELIQNIVKHAQANEAYIQLGYRDGLLSITIEDDGIGLDNNEQSINKGLGLVSIKNRIQTLNGTIEISSEKGSGTSIILDFAV